ncbi:MAG: hypothetical protein NTY38_20500 [Acidobacteria bacterium]|nr:hypothetical protein [Acidobacteriota bacterium]
MRRTFIPLVFGGGLANRVKAAPADLAVTPTPLYTRAGTRLERLLAASINDPALSSGSLELTAGGRARRIRVDGLERSGSRVLVPIQALDETTTVHCSYRRGDILWSTRLTVAPERLWKIFVVHHSHQDPGYLGLPDKMRADFIAYLDEALDYCSRTRNRDPRARFKWTIEVGYLLEDYRKARGEEAFSRVIAAIKSGAMELGALYVSAQSEFLGVEPLHRLLTYSSLKLPREFGIEVRTALHDDVPGFTWGLAEALAHSGVRYLLLGANS